MAVRQFSLINEKGQEFSLMDIQKYCFLSSPTGLGIEFNSSYEQVGNSFVESIRKVKQGKIPGTLYFAGYDKYLDFSNFAFNSEKLRFKYIINNDMDLQPRITPILDLSNIRSGMSDINSMFNYDNLNRNLSAISNVNIGNQNRRNDDVVSAINKLSDSLNSYNGNVINIYPQELDKDSLNEIVDEVNRNFGKVYK